MTCPSQQQGRRQSRGPAPAHRNVDSFHLDNVSLLLGGWRNFASMACAVRDS
jgi:hypothetical protein